MERCDNDTKEELDELKFWSDAKEWSEGEKKSPDKGWMMVDAPTLSDILSLSHLPNSWPAALIQLSSSLRNPFFHWNNSRQIGLVHRFRQRHTDQIQIKKKKKGFNKSTTNPKVKRIMPHRSLGQWAEQMSRFAFGFLPCLTLEGSTAHSSYLSFRYDCRESFNPPPIWAIRK